MSEENFNPTVATVRHVIGKTFKSALKGALVGGLALAGLAALPALGVTLASFGLLGGVAASGVGSALVTGAMIGGGLGGAVGLVTGITGAEEAVAEEQQVAETKALRQRQLAANQEMMAMNMERMRAAQQAGAMGTPAHGLGGVGMGPAAGKDIGMA